MIKKIVVSLCVLTLLFSCVRRREGVPNSSSRHQYTQERVRTSSGRHESRNSQGARPSQPQPSNTADNKVLTGTQIFEKYNPAVFMIYTSDGWNDYQGSGFFVTSSGIGVSNYHVFEGTTVGYETIKLSNGQTYKIRNVIAKSKEDDFIVFQVETKGYSFNYIPLGKKDPKVGEKVYTIGSPLGLENTFSSGEISQLREDYLIQINAPIDHGSSGGALINEYGEVIGITTSGIESSGANLNFAVDIDVVRPYVR